MPVKIRLTRIGAKKKPYYRIVVMESRKKRDGGFIDRIGTYTPITNPPFIEMNMEKYNEWIKKGALPTQAVLKIIKLKTKQEKGGITEVGEKENLNEALSANEA